MGLAQILVRVPEGSSEEEMKALRAKAQGLLARVRKGESFEEVAKASSDGPEASRGGDMGVRPLNGWPDLFLKGVAGVQDGRISNIIQSPNGFHILKVIGRAGGAPPAPKPQPQATPAPGTPGGPMPQGPMPVQQTQARHILIKTTAVVSDENARKRLEQIRERIVQGGEPFSDMAKRFSNDGSAPQGGVLGWLNPGETVPPFEKAMNALKEGEISQPVQSQFGWHLIVVDGRRTQDMADQFIRNQARQQIFQQRSNAAFETWLQQVRSQAFIDNRLEKSQRQSGR
jgi:peptidyl-prolyl cis-trans isomerase SurA